MRKTNSSMNYSMILPGTLISRSRKPEKRGGINGSDGLSWEHRVDLENEDIEVLCIEIRPKSVLIVSVYCLPDSSKHINKDLNELNFLVACYKSYE